MSSAQTFPVHQPFQQMQAPQPMCAFPSPPPRTMYCNPAPYSQDGGQRYFYLVQAYGAGRKAH